MPMWSIRTQILGAPLAPHHLSLDTFTRNWVRFEKRSFTELRRGRAVIVMDKFVVPIGLPGLTVVRRERLLPLCYNLRTFGIHCPGVADDNRYAVERIRSFENPYVAVKLADYRRLNDAP
jgi:hypothetical protein